jgi:hypothetical protein
MAAAYTVSGSPKAHEMKKRDTVEAPECGGCRCDHGREVENRLFKLGLKRADETAAKREKIYANLWDAFISYLYNLFSR